MLTRRHVTLAVLFLLPILVYVGIGGYALWKSGLLLWIGWVLPVFWMITWVVAWYWPAKSIHSQLEEFKTPSHWTKRDHAAREILRQYQERVDEYTPEQLIDLHFYLDRGQQLAKDLAKVYHPEANDPISELTVPEVVAAARLAVDDLEDWLLKSVPGSHLVTIDQWKGLAHAPKWVGRAQNAAWAASLLINPANAIRLATKRGLLDPAVEKLKSEFLAMAYLRFVRRLGFYLIEMNSGRLRGGSRRYLDSFSHRAMIGADFNYSGEVDEDLHVLIVAPEDVDRMNIIQALGAELVQSESEDKKEESAYELKLPEKGVRLLFHHAPAFDASKLSWWTSRSMHKAVESADLVVFVKQADHELRAGEEKFFRKFEGWFSDSQEFAPLVVCLLSGKEETQITSADHVRDSINEIIADHISGFVMIQSSDDISSRLRPKIVDLLGHASAAAAVRDYHEELGKERMSAVFGQLKHSTSEVLTSWIDERLRRKRQRKEQQENESKQ